MRSSWIEKSSKTIYCRNIGSNACVFVPVLNSTKKLSLIHVFTRQDTLQYKLAHGQSIMDKELLQNNIIETSVFHHTIIHIQSWIRMMKYRNKYTTMRKSVVRIQKMVRQVYS